MSLNGLAYEYIWFSFPTWWNVSVVFSIFTSLIFMPAFSRQFLNLKVNAPILDKIALAAMAAAGTGAILSLFVPYALGVRLVAVLGASAPLIFLVAGIICWKKGVPAARYYTIAWILYLTGILLISFRNLGLLPHMFVTTYSIQIGSAVEVILLSLGLADRINVMRREKFMAQREALLSQAKTLEAQEKLVINHREIDKLKDEMNLNLENKVRERTEELNSAMEELVLKNDHIMDSIRYSRIIQKAILPDPERVKTLLPQSFFIWQPRDLVGGDTYYCERFDTGIIIVIIDCTGHGIPGAFMTMLASSGLQRIVSEEKILEPATILKHMNRIIKTSLRQKDGHSKSDDGLDAAVCFFEFESRDLLFAGARLHLYYIEDNALHTIKGDSQSIGYVSSDLLYKFTTHRIANGHREKKFYLSTDGFIDQHGQRKLQTFRQQTVQADAPQPSRPLLRQSEGNLPRRV